MYFDKEQWLVTGDETPQLCLGVIDNTVLVGPRIGGRYKVCVRVPSGIFTFVKDVLHLDNKALTKHPVRFYLEEDQPGDWYFVLATLALPHALDLWPYKGLPGWAVRGRCLSR